MIIITKTDALIGINTTPAKMSIIQPKPDFEILQQDSELLIDTEQLQVRIDQTQCFNEAGLKNNSALSEDMVNRSQQAFSEGISRVVSEGNQMASIENGYNAIAEIAFNNSIQVTDWNIDFIPKSRPRIDYVGGTVDIRINEGYVDVKSKPNMPIIDVELGGIEFYLRQNPEIKFEYVGNNLDMSI
ncbi:MAG: hypothetical protein K0Q99_1131 [Clostridia bacterium]|jgi:hypothetical protein|nr:hypothetical protein [Clostridia bacterium]